jgi:hypothetical protein
MGNSYSYDLRRDWDTERLLSLLSWLKRGVSFASAPGFSWNAQLVGTVLDGLNMIHNALGGFEDFYLGLSDGLTFRLDPKIGTNRGWAPDMDTVLLNESAGGDVYAVIHELGHVVDYVLSRVTYGTSGYPAEAGKQWAVDQVSYSSKSGFAKQFGWYKDKTSSTGWSTNQPGETTYYAGNRNTAPTEDFAESFTQFVYDRNRSSSGFGRTVNTARREFVQHLIWGCQVAYNP